MFKVKVDNQHEVLAQISGKMWRQFVRLTAVIGCGWKSLYDLTKPRVTFRLR
jgi:translation initiation factor IF-1